MTQHQGLLLDTLRMEAKRGGRKFEHTLTLRKLRARKMDLVHRIRDAKQITMTNASNASTY